MWYNFQGKHYLRRCKGKKGENQGGKSDKRAMESNARQMEAPVATRTMNPNRLADKTHENSTRNSYATLKTATCGGGKRNLAAIFGCRYVIYGIHDAIYG
jgi:hypothetical protein